MVGLQLKAGYTGSNPVADEVYHAMSRCIKEVLRLAGVFGLPRVANPMLEVKRIEAVPLVKRRQ